MRSGRENMVIAEISDGRAEVDDVIGPAFREPVSTPRGGRRRAMAQSELIASRACLFDRPALGTPCSAARSLDLRKKAKLTSSRTSFARTRFRTKGSTERDLITMAKAAAKKMTKKVAAKKSPAKTAAPKTAVKPTARKVVAKKATRKAAVKKSAVKKPAKKAAPKKAVAKKAAGKKVAVKKAAVKKAAPVKRKKSVPAPPAPTEPPPST
jgi:hypothetical protein